MGIRRIRGLKSTVLAGLIDRVRSNKTGLGARYLVVATMSILFVYMYVTDPAIEVFVRSLRLSLFPSAEKAYEYGNDYFESTRAWSYDISAARFFYAKAYELDHTLPHVQHQRARIAFLEGDFDRALMLINDEIEKGEDGPLSDSSYYVRALIYGFKGDYAQAAKDYETYLRTDPTNWAAINDYAWVLLRGGQAEESFIATAYGLEYHPSNVWLLNSHAIALFELGRAEEALEYIQKAQLQLPIVTEREWLTAYPGNNPSDAAEGMNTLRQSVRENLRKIEAKVSAAE